MTIPYEQVRPGTNAIREMEKTLATFGCSAFGTMTDNDKGCMVVSFRWRDQQVTLEANWKGYAELLVQRSKWKRADALEHAKRAVCSVLRDWVKAQTTAVECGVMTFSEVFMPHMLLPDGRRVIDAAQAAKLLPPPSEPKVIELKKIV